MRNLRRYFPFFTKHSKVLCLNGAATTHKPAAMINAKEKLLKKYSDPSSLVRVLEEKLFSCRQKIGKLLKCPPENIFFFPQGSTTCINFVAQSLELICKKPGTTTIVSEIEHNSNILPWLRYSKNLSFLNYNQATYKIEPPSQESLVNASMISLTAYSNVLGQVWDNDFQDLKKIIMQARQANCYTFIDGAQVILDKGFSWQKIQPDFMCFSAHKVYGPTNLGILIVKKDIQKLLDLPQSLTDSPFWEVVEFEQSLKFCISQKLKKQGELICKQLSREFFNFLSLFPEVKFLRNYKKFSFYDDIISFNIKNVHPHDVADILAQEGVVIRGGTHCAKILHDSFKEKGSLRLSFSVYNNFDDLEKFKASFIKCINFLRKHEL